jgi:gluconolactonase
VISEGSAGRVLADRLGFTEGPLWTSDHRLLVASVSRGLVYDVDLDGAGSRVVVEVGGGLSGLAEDAAGAIWIAQGGPGLRSSSSGVEVVPALQRWRRRQGGRVEDVVRGGLTAPNDCVVGPDGAVWFTDPAGPAMEGTPEPGRVMVWDPAAAEVRVAATDLWFPNGLAFSIDGVHLYVAETAARRVSRFRRDGHSLVEHHVLHDLATGRPDGLAVDAGGRVHVAATSASSVLVIDPAGCLIEAIGFDDGAMPTNVCFAGPGLTTLVVTAAKGGRVVAVPRPVPGAALPVAGAA